MEAIGPIESDRSYDENDLLPISALQHLFFCERRCALIHIEQSWSENRFTAEGRVMHERVHEAAAESRGDVRIVRGLRLRSLELGLIGMADVVEFHREADGTNVPGLKGAWRVMPVEYKRGRPKKNACDEIQLCAQALCLEEMLHCKISGGALFYGKTRRRKNVVFDAVLREETVRTAERLHQLIETGRTPPAVYEKKCDSCSLMSVCMPNSAARGKSAKAFLERAINDVLKAG